MRILRADITTLPVDAIVNAANSSLMGGGGVDGAIHRAAGPELALECLRLGRCAVGDVKVSGGHRLPARFVFHTVGPVWRGGSFGEDEMLASCYRACMEAAKARELTSVAFPAISCGRYRFPIPRAAEIAVGTVRRSLGHGTTVTDVVFALVDERVLAAYGQVLAPGE